MSGIGPGSRSRSRRPAEPGIAADGLRPPLNSSIVGRTKAGTDRSSGCLLPVEFLVAVLMAAGTAPAGCWEDGVSVRKDDRTQIIAAVRRCSRFPVVQIERPDPEGHAPTAPSPFAPWCGGAAAMPTVTSSGSIEALVAGAFSRRRVVGASLPRQLHVASTEPSNQPLQRTAARAVRSMVGSCRDSARWRPRLFAAVVRLRLRVAAAAERRDVGRTRAHGLSRDDQGRGRSTGRRSRTMVGTDSESCHSLRGRPIRGYQSGCQRSNDVPAAPRDGAGCRRLSRTWA